MSLLSLAVIVGAFIGVVATTTPAAAATPYLYTNIRGGYVPMFFAPTNQSNVKAWLPNYRGFVPQCYTDFQNWYGNYWSTRWFFGQELGGTVGYVHSSQVINQQLHPVGRC